MKVAILGGSFDPIQNAHIKLIKTVLQRKIVDEVWIIPCKSHPFDKNLAEAKHRVEMIKIAIENLKNVKICGVELKSKGKNFTLKTIRKLKQRYNHEFSFIIGSDILNDISNWYKSRLLFDEARFIIFLRKGYRLKKVQGMNVIATIRENPSSISSSETRNRIRQSKSIPGLVQGKVSTYIKRERLYND